MTTSPSITFVCCVESGSLESQTLRMIESLRRWGGRLANAPILAVTPRLGPPLSRKTHQAFERLQVEYLHFSTKNQYSWFKYLNKPYALVAAEERSTTESIGWLDSDLLFVDEPVRLMLNEGEHFVACAPDKNIGTSGSEDPFEPYWQEICHLVGLDIEDLPWITTEMEGHRIRLYWNSGIFVYRRATGFTSEYLQTCIHLLNARLANHNSGIFFTDQVALGLTMVKGGLSWRALPYSHNYTMSRLLHDEWYKEEQLKEAKILHYHDFMWPPYWPEFIRCLGNTHPAVADWLSSCEPMKNEAPLQWRVMSQVLKHFRSRKESAYKKLCRVI
jgi:hypothetical protein